MANVLGAVVDVLLADAGVTALVSVSSIFAGLTVEEARLPFVAVQDQEQPPEWLTFSSRLERHDLTVTVHAYAALPPDDGDPPPANPAEAIADAVEAAINWDDLPDLFTTCNVIQVARKQRRRSVEMKREPQARRVFRVELGWLVELEDFDAPYSGD